MLADGRPASVKLYDVDAHGDAEIAYLRAAPDAPVTLVRAGVHEGRRWSVMLARPMIVARVPLDPAGIGTALARFHSQPLGSGPRRPDAAEAVDAARALARRYSGNVPAKLPEVDHHLARPSTPRPRTSSRQARCYYTETCGPATC